MKKAIALTLALLTFILSLTACGEIQNTETTSSETQAETTTESQTTISAEEQKKIDDRAYIKQHLQELVTDMDFSIYVYFLEEAPEKIHISISRMSNFNHSKSLIVLSNYIEILKNALNHTGRSLDTFEYFYFTNDVGYATTVRKIIWTSSDLENGKIQIISMLDNSIIEQLCSFEEFIDYDITEYVKMKDS